MCIESKLRRIKILRSLLPPGGDMVGRSRSKRAKPRGNPTKAQFVQGLADIVVETVRLWRKHHLGYDQTKYVVEQARRRLKLQPVRRSRRTVDRLDESEVERLIRHTYQTHNKYGLMITQSVG
jgi:integrase/recombinase XerD